MSSESKYINNQYQDFFEKSLKQSDPDIYKAINDELIRQQNHIELIASENIVSQAVLEAQGSVLTNKYAEGYPGKRYYNGCEHVDVAEELAIERLKKLFNCKFANAQPHSGAQANGAVFLALLKPGDTFMGMSLNSGGHITHGLKISMSGKWFNAIGYDVDKQSELIDYDNVETFYFDIRKDVLYCDGNTPERRSARTVLDLIFHRLTSWLAPVLVFTMEEVWLERYPGDESSVHLIDIPETPRTWRDESLAIKWATVRQARRAVTAALELKRTDKIIGSSLEASPVVYLEDQTTFDILNSIPFADICITSSITLSLDKAPKSAFSSDEVKGIAVDFKVASGEKCQRCWKILPEVNTTKPICGRCNNALKAQENFKNLSF